MPLHAVMPFLTVNAAPAMIPRFFPLFSKRNCNRSWKSLISTSLLTLTICVLPGCGSEDDSASEKKKGGRSKSASSFADLLPEDTILYIRINDVQRAKNEFIRSEHVTDAAVAQKAINDLIDKQLKAIKRDGNPFGVSGLTLLQFVNDLKAVHFALWELTPQGEPKPDGGVLILELSGTSGLKQIRKELGDKLKTEKINGREVYTLELP